MSNSILIDFIQTNNPLIWVYSQEEYRFIEDECSKLKANRSKIYVCDARNTIFEFAGIYEHEGSENSAAYDRQEYDGPVDVINAYSKPSQHDWEETNKNGNSWSIREHGYPDNSILIVMDMPFYMVDAAKIKHTNAMLTRTIKSAALCNVAQRKTIVFVNHHKTVPVELEHMVTFVEHELPKVDALKKLVVSAQGMVSSKAIPAINLDEENIIKTANQLKGLTLYQAENILAQANRANAIDYNNGSVKERFFRFDIIQKEKTRLISKSSTIEIIEPKFTLNDVGGMDNLKRWAKDREMIFRHEAREEGIDMPKGILVVGPGGTGKSYVAQALAKTWSRPLLRLDISACMGSLLGESEGKLIKALKDAEAQAPCILFVD